MTKFTIVKLKREISFKREMKIWGPLSFKMMAEVGNQSNQRPANWYRDQKDVGGNTCLAW